MACWRHGGVLLLLSSVFSGTDVAGERVITDTGYKVDSVLSPIPSPCSGGGGIFTWRQIGCRIIPLSCGATYQSQCRSVEAGKVGLMLLSALMLSSIYR
jgi:hypothetical protein